MYNCLLTAHLAMECQQVTMLPPRGHLSRFYDKAMLCVILIVHSVKCEMLYSARSINISGHVIHRIDFTWQRQITFILKYCKRYCFTLPMNINV